MNQHPLVLPVLILHNLLLWLALSNQIVATVLQRTSNMSLLFLLSYLYSRCHVVTGFPRPPVWSSILSSSQSSFVLRVGPTKSQPYIFVLLIILSNITSLNISGSQHQLRSNHQQGLNSRQQPELLQEKGSALLVSQTVDWRGLSGLPPYTDLRI